MRKILLALGALLLATACAPEGVIQGKVHVGPGQDGLAVFALVWQVTTDASGKPTSQLLGQLSVGTATAQGGTFDYVFHSLPAGEYIVGAWADLNDDRQLTDDLIQINQDQPLTLTADKNSLTQDVWLGASAPDRATVRGTVHLSDKAASSQVTVYVIDRGELANQGQAQVLAQRALGPGTDVTYAVFNVPATSKCSIDLGTKKADGTEDTASCDLHVLAIANVGNDQDTSNDLVAYYPLNPLTTSAGQEVTGVDLWMDRQSPDLGSIGGSVTFNAHLDNLQLTLAVLSANPSQSDVPELEALLNLPANDTTSVNFTIPSIKQGTHYLFAQESTVDPDGTTHTAQRYYTVNHQYAPVTLTADAKNKTDLVFPLGVGRISGTVNVSGAPSSVAGVGVFAVPPWNASSFVGQPDTQRADVEPLTLSATGTGKVGYSIFGLEDDSYQMALFPVVKGSDGSLSFNTSKQYTGTPLTVKITGGGRGASDFTVSFAQ